MLLITACLLVLVKPTFSDGSNKDCPSSCTCQLEHLTETAIYRFMHQDRKRPVSTEVTSSEFNDVLYEENLDYVLFVDKQIVRSAMCIIQTETEPLELLHKLPADIESLTLIQGYDTGNKIIKFSYLSSFKNLISVELLGPNALNKRTNSRLVGEIDTPLPNLKYLNLENILIKNSKTQLQNFVKEVTDDVLTFEYVQKFDTRAHPLTMVQKGMNEEVLPYEKYKEQDNTNTIPLFIGFKNLFLLRITQCELNNVHWAMFDGLSNLVYLILDKNNLRFIPSFAFYGTPNLKTLSLAHNNLLDIQITDLAGLLELEYLDLSYNNFSQLSELSLPPFPKLKLANFANNPITMIFPNTFEVMNTTDSLIIGSDDVHVSLMPNSFLGLNLLKALTLNNLNVKMLKRDMFVGMPNLQELILTGNIKMIDFDTFLDVYKLKKLILNDCSIQSVSMDAFIGLDKLEYLDLSRNDLEHLPPALFDPLTGLKELYLNGNKIKELPRDIFSKVHAKLIRLNENPWHCSCQMSEWKPMIVNRIKQKIFKPCDNTHDKGIGCSTENRFAYKYTYENKVAPKCSAPSQYLNWSVFHVMRRLLKCPEYKPKFKKHHHRKTDIPHIKTTNATTHHKQSKFDILEKKLKKHSEPQFDRNGQDNDINILYRPLETFEMTTNMSSQHKDKNLNKIRKLLLKNNDLSNAL